MYKVLVIASTEHILQMKTEFEKSGLSYDYLIANKKSTYDFGCLEDQYLNIDQELIPFSEKVDLKLLTKSQRQKKIIVDSQMSQLRYILFQNLKMTKKSYASKFLNDTPNSNLSEVFYFDDVVDLKINQKDKKIHIEILKSSVRSYDHVLIEDSYLNLSLFSEKFKQHGLFDFQTQQVFQFLGLKFKMSDDLGNYKFWSMSDSNYNSIYDNLYYISVLNSVMDVWLWLPAQQLKNPATKGYFTERALKHLGKKFDFLNFEILSESLSLQPINTYMASDCNYKNQITFLPQFHFYSPLQMTKAAGHLSDSVMKKIKIKKEFMQFKNFEESV
jgi:hypothetical protein